MNPHVGFIAAAYAVTGLVVAGMLLGILLDHRAQTRTLSMLTDRLRRQPGSAPPEARIKGSDDREP